MAGWLAGWLAACLPACLPWLDWLAALSASVLSSLRPVMFNDPFGYYHW
jgi:hypothetical protein